MDSENSSTLLPAGLPFGGRVWLVGVLMIFRRAECLVIFGLLHSADRRNEMLQRCLENRRAAGAMAAHPSLRPTTQGAETTLQIGAFRSLRNLPEHPDPSTHQTKIPLISNHMKAPRVLCLAAPRT